MSDRHETVVNVNERPVDRVEIISNDSSSGIVVGVALLAAVLVALFFWFRPFSGPASTSVTIEAPKASPGQPASPSPPTIQLTLPSATPAPAAPTPPAPRPAPAR